MKNLFASLFSLAFVGAALLVAPPAAQAQSCQGGYCQQVCNGTEGYCTYMDCGDGTEMCRGARADQPIIG